MKKNLTLKTCKKTKIKLKNQRRCILTREIKDKKKLIRIVMKKNGSFKVNSNDLGRGAYVSRDSKLIKLILKNKSLHKVFKTNVSNEVYEKLIEEMQKKG